MIERSVAMETELVYSLRGYKRQAWEALLRSTDLTPDDAWESTVLSKVLKGSPSGL